MRNVGMLMRSMFLDLIASRELAWRLFVRDISAKYRQSIFGLLWAFLPPILAGVLFIILQTKNVFNFRETDIPYPVYALIGTTLWQIFADSLNAPLNTVVTAKPMLAKINFPREALIVSAFYNMLFNFFIKSIILVGIFFYFDLRISWSILLAPLAIIMLILLGLTIGLLLTPLGTLYTDIRSALTIFIQFWFFITPVVYPPPQSFPYSLMVTMNPVSPILIGAREICAKGYISNIGPFLIVSLLTIIFLFFSLILYRLSLPIIIERMSA
jgi:lipopolysaccharide transport system permease protein